MRQLSLICTTVSSMALAWAVPADAQDVTAPSSQESVTAAEQDQVEETRTERLAEVVVTARRREENLLSVPVSVSTLSEAAIAATGVKNLTELSNFTPGLISEPQGTGGLPDRSANRLVFRGLSTSFGTIFIDGAPYTATNTPDVTDVSRVEVLNGPQSVYFGRATFSGAVNYVTRTPANEFSGRVSAEAGQYDRYELRAMIEGPIVRDLLTVRVSARHFEFGGQYRSAVSGLPLGEQRTDNLSVAIASNPTPNLSMSVYYAFSEDEDSQPAATKLRVFGTTPTLTCDLGGTSAYFCGALPDLADLDPRQIGENTIFTDFVRGEYVDNARGYPLAFNGPGLDHFGLKRRVHHVHGRIDFETDGGWQLAALGSYTNSTSTNIRGLLGADTSNLPNPFPPILGGVKPQFVSLSSIADREDNDVFGEARVSTPQRWPVRATLGASYFKTYGPPAVGYGIVNIGRLPSAGEGGLDFGSSTPAVFGGVYADVTDRLTLSAEARYQWDTIEQRAVLTTNPRVKETYRSFSPRVTADFEIANNSLLYATYSRGFKPGGFNLGLQNLNAAQLAQLAERGITIAFDQEKLDNFELGHKGAWFNNRLRTTLALYYMKWGDGQVTTSQFVEGPPPQLVSLTSNVGRVNLHGAELTADLFVNRNLSVSGTLDYTDNEIKEFSYPDGDFILGTTNVNGNRLDHVSKWRFSVSPVATFDGPGDTSTQLRVDWLYRSKWFIDPSNSAYIAGRHLVNARVSWDIQKKFLFELFVNNLLNDDTLIEGLRAPETLYSANPPALTTAITPTVNSIFLGLPDKRLIGARATIRF